MKFLKLFQPGKIGTMNIRNRIIMAPTGTNFPGDGGVTNRAINFYLVRAKGGVGLIIVEGTSIDPLYGVGKETSLKLFEEKSIPTFKQLSSVIKEYDVKTSIQLWHRGALASMKFTGRQSLSPSGITVPGVWEIPKIITLEEINSVINAYVYGAINAKEAGFDSVQIHAGAGLIHSFLSPYYNKRKDDYGGDITSRMKLLIEIIKRIKGKVGKDYPIICRINAEDKFCQITIKDAQALAVELEKAGIDAIELINGSMAESHGVPIYTMEVPQGHFAYLARKVKKIVNIPVISNIRINDPRIAEKILRDGKADFVSMSRALIADPELPNKATAGNLEHINKCITCMICIDEALKSNHIKCTVNAQAGFEQDRNINPANRIKKILVIGGGPAGLEAARVAALRGHRVFIYEKNSQLGGQLLLAAKPPHKEEMWYLIDYLLAQIKRYGVTIRLGCKITADSVRKENPDAVIVATGPLPVIPTEIAIEDGNVVFPSDILSETVEAGQSVVIIGGGLVGIETAEFLATNQRQVSVIEIMDRICADMPIFARDDLIRRVRKLRVNILTETKVDKIIKNTILLRKNGKQQIVQADTVIIATGSNANRKLTEELERIVPELYSVGDCQKPGKIIEAIHEGFMVGNKV